MVEMDLLGVRLELPANAPVVLLREQSGARRVLPIYIGTEEAKSIAQALEGVVTPRPFTHDLIRDLLAAVKVSVPHIIVTELRDRTYYAEIEMRLDGQVKRVSSRPSDAIALAVRVGALIFCSEEVLEEAASIPIEEAPAQDQIVDEFRSFIEKVNPDDFA